MHTAIFHAGAPHILIPHIKTHYNFTQYNIDKVSLYSEPRINCCAPNISNNFKIIYSSHYTNQNYTETLAIQLTVTMLGLEFRLLGIAANAAVI